MPRVGIDLDLTSFETTKPLLRRIEERHGIRVERSEMTDVRYNQNGPLRSFTDEQMRLLYLESCWQNGSYRKLALMDPEVPRILNSTPFEPFINTTSWAENRDIHGLLGMHSLRYTDLYHLEHAVEKLDREAVVYVDDHPGFAEAAAKQGKRVILYKQPHNIAFINENGLEGDKSKYPSITVAWGWPTPVHGPRAIEQQLDDTFKKWQKFMRSRSENGRPSTFARPQHKVRLPA